MSSLPSLVYEGSLNNKGVRPLSSEKRDWGDINAVALQRVIEQVPMEEGPAQHKLYLPVPDDWGKTDTEPRQWVGLPEDQHTQHLNVPSVLKTYY